MQAEDVVTKNKVVFLTYSILDERGQGYEQYDMPIGYVHGANSELFYKIEQSLEGKKSGDRIEVQLNPEEGFSRALPELIFTDDLKNVPPEFQRLGAEVEFENEKGETRQFCVTKLEAGKITIDGNHPLAGQTVVFVVNITSIRDATMDEVANGRPDEAGPKLH